jgi:hypothetical protein
MGRTYMLGDTQIFCGESYCGIPGKGFWGKRRASASCNASRGLEPDGKSSGEGRISINARRALWHPKGVVTSGRLYSGRLYTGPLYSR